MNYYGDEFLENDEISIKTHEKWKLLETKHPKEYALLRAKPTYLNNSDGLAGPGLSLGLGWLGWLAWRGLLGLGRTGCRSKSYNKNK